MTFLVWIAGAAVIILIAGGINHIRDNWID